MGNACQRMVERTCHGFLENGVFINQMVAVAGNRATLHVKRVGLVGGRQCGSSTT